MSSALLKGYKAIIKNTIERRIPNDFSDPWLTNVVFCFYIIIELNLSLLLTALAVYL
jgi:hypothetical protein